MQALIQRYVVAGGVQIQYLERAAESDTQGSPILLLHALLATAETLTELIADLPADRRIVAFDLLSAQRVSPEEKLEVDFDALARLVHEFMGSVGLVRPVVIGHSHGGVIALRLAVTQRNLLAGLALLCPAHPFGGYRSDVVNFYLTRIGRTLALSIPLAPTFMILRAYRQAAGPNSRISMQQLRRYMGVLRNRDTLRRVLQMLMSWEADMEQLRLALVEKPIAISTLLIWGDLDVIVPMSTATKLEAHLQHWQRATLPGMGHLLAEEAPAECARLINAWLDKVTP